MKGKVLKYRQLLPLPTIPTQIPFLLIVVGIIILSFMIQMFFQKNDSNALFFMPKKPSPPQITRTLPNRPSPTPTPIKSSPTAKPTSTPSPTTTPKPPQIAPMSSLQKQFGVNLSGGEFGDGSLPGIINKDYIYPTDPQEYGYFSNKGLKLVRLPFRWERVQYQALGDLSTTDIASIKVAVNVAAEKGQKVILDMHNYGRYYNIPLGRADNTKFADIWKKLAVEFKDNSAVYGYELMNEPHDLPDGSDAWASLAQSAVNAIRQVDTMHYVLVPGYDWQSANRWPQSNPNLTISDPSKKSIYAAHVYFDQDHSGRYTQSYEGEGGYDNVGSDRVQPFLNWLHEKNALGIFTEYGIPSTDSRWLTVLERFLSTVSNNSQIIGGAYWSAGPWWGGYPLSVDPSTGDHPQMQILQKYPSK